MESAQWRWRMEGGEAKEKGCGLEGGRLTRQESEKYWLESLWWRIERG